MKKLLIIISASVFLCSAVFAQESTGTSSTSKTADKTTKTAVFRPTKDQIKQVQTILKEKKLYNGEASGSYNDETRAGIKSFQKDNGLTQTGTLNRATLEKFGVELTDSQKETPASPSSFATATSAVKSATTTAATTTTDAVKTAGTATANAVKRPAPFRANADQIKAAQKILKDGTMYAGEQTGKLDDATREGLKKFQDANKLKVTGTLNSLTLEKMGIALTDKQKEQVAAQAVYDASKAKKN